MRLQISIFLSSVIISALGQNTTESSTTSKGTTTTAKATTTTVEITLTTTTGTPTSKGTSSTARSTTVGHRICGNPGETEVCHYSDDVKEVCDVCFGILCSHGRRCVKTEGKCQHECVCPRRGEIPDKEGICRAACTQNPCHNNGTCTVQGIKEVCRCVPGYQGELCDATENICLEQQPSRCPTGAYECLMEGVNNYKCSCAAGYVVNKENQCVKVGHSVQLEVHFIETPYSEIYNDPSKPEYAQVREIIRLPFDELFGERLVALEFHNFTQGSLVANLLLQLKPAEKGNQYTDEYTFKEHILQCGRKESSTTPECFGRLGRVFLPVNAWQLQDERCDNVMCPPSTQCQPVEGEPDQTRCICSTGYEGYGSILDAFGTVVELCKDVNECSTIAGVCRSDEICVNTPGSFDCKTPCKGIQCPGHAKCFPNEDGSHRCECSWIYAGSYCAFPWTLIFLSTTGVLLASTLTAAFLVWKATANDKKGRYPHQRIQPHIITVNQ